MAGSVNLGKVMITPKGEYDPEVQYEKLDVVSYEGSGYICIRDTVGQQPGLSDAWIVVVEKGETPKFSVSAESTEPGTEAEVEQAGTDLNPSLHFKIPKSQDGVTPTFKIGSVEGVDYGKAPEVTMTKEENDYALNFKLERGRPGETPEAVTLSVNGKTPNEEGAVTLEPSDLSAVPASRTVNGKSLESDITITAEDLGIDPNATGTVKSVNSKSPDEAGNVNISYEDVGAKPAGYEPDLSGYVPTARTINGQSLAFDVNLTAESVGAKPAGYEPDLSGYAPVGRTVNGKPLTTDITLNAAEVGARDASWMPSGGEIPWNAYIGGGDVNNPIWTHNQSALAAYDFVIAADGRPWVNYLSGIGSPRATSIYTDEKLTFVLSGTTLYITKYF